MNRGMATAPASSGNLGPGFDTLALALELRCRCEAEPADEWEILERGTRYAPEPEDLVVRAVAAAIGDRPIRLAIENEIPRSRGLGSSSAVATASAAAAMRAVGVSAKDATLFRIVADLEGHPDNAAAAVYGGLVATADGVVRHLPLAPEVIVVAGIPDGRLSTHEARAALPTDVPHGAAARNVARVAMLIEGLRTADPAALGAARGDELHEAPRRRLSPVTGRLMDAARDAGALHAAWSGAGPAALAFTTSEACDAVVSGMRGALGGSGEVLVLSVATDGWR